MRCLACGEQNLVDGTIEGILPSPISQLHKFLGKGVYGTTVLACLDCGAITNWRLTQNALDELRMIVDNESPDSSSMRRGTMIQCGSCKNSELIEGTLEGAYFKPSKEHKRGLLARPVHHPIALVCPKCGGIQNIRLSIDELKKAVKNQ